MVEWSIHRCGHVVQTAGPNDAMGRAGYTGPSLEMAHRLGCQRTILRGLGIKLCTAQAVKQRRELRVGLLPVIKQKQGENQRDKTKNQALIRPGSTRPDRFFDSNIKYVNRKTHHQ